jgi:phage baseplate assembly protein gpV
MGDSVRIARVSSINYRKGMASVVYTDRNDEVSLDLPFLSYAYEMPELGDTVVVLALQNSSTKKFILGIPWSDSNGPTEYGKGIYHKRFSDGTHVKYDANKKEMEITADKIILKEIRAGSLTVSELEVTGTATINNLVVTGTATGHYPG